MKRINNNIVTVIISSIFALSMLSSCGSAPTKKEPIVDCEDDCGGGEPSNDELCKNLKSSDYIKNNSTQSVTRQFVDEICNKGLLSKLRQSLYSGGGSPTVRTLDSKEFSSTKHTSSKVASGMESPLDPEQHYNMLRMQSLEPDKFKKSYKVGANVEYDLKNTGASSGNTVADYYYKNSITYSGEPFAIIYYGKTYFIPIKDGVTYVVANKLNDSKKSEGTVETMSGIIVINKNTSAKHTEVLAITSQKADNKGNHKNALQASRDFLEDDIKRAHENASKFKD